MTIAAWPPMSMSGTNVGDLLNAAKASPGDGSTAIFRDVNSERRCLLRQPIDSHYDPFQYYQITANPHHLPPSSDGHDRTARSGESPICAHRFFNAIAAGNFPAVAF